MQFTPLGEFTPRGLCITLFIPAKSSTILLLEGKDACNKKKTLQIEGMPQVQGRFVPG